MDDLDRVLAAIKGDYQPDQRAPERVRAMLAASLGPAGTITGQAAGSESIAPGGAISTPSSWMTSATFKGILAALAVGGAATMGLRLRTTDGGEPPRRPAASVAPAVAAPQHAPVAQALEARPVAAVEVLPEDAPVMQRSRSSEINPRRGHTLEELQLLSAASRAFRAGDLVEAERALGEHRARYPRSALAQERHGLSLEIRCARGVTPAVRAEAQRFVQADESSPISSSVRKKCLE